MEHLAHEHADHDGRPGFGIINGHIYIAGGRNLANTNLNTLYDYDIATDTWTQRANLPTGINVPGSAVIAGKLWVFGGGDPFANGSPAAPASPKQGLRGWLTRLFRPDTTNILQVYDAVTDTWSSGPSLNQQRSFPAGTGVGNTAVAVGGFTEYYPYTTTSVEINVTSGGCANPTPTATPTATAMATFTPTPTPTAAPTGTPTSTATSTPTPTSTPRPSPSPRSRPTPFPRP